MLQNHSDSSEEIAADSHNGDVDLDESQLKGNRQETSPAVHPDCVRDSNGSNWYYYKTILGSFKLN